jgi:hypothetical protein
MMLAPYATPTVGDPVRRLLCLTLPIVALGLLAAGCGSSGGDSTATHPLPAGKMGAQGAERCPLPTLDGATVTEFSVRNMSCDGGVAGVESVYRTGRYPGWSCRTTSRPTVNADCTRENNSSVSFSASWTVK